MDGYDYRLAGGYFVTVVAFQKKCIFGNIVNGEMSLNPIGIVIQAEWVTLPQHLNNIRLDTFVIMPNHVHGIIIIDSGEALRATRVKSENALDHNIRVVDMKNIKNGGSPLLAITRPHGPPTGSLGAVIGQFKSRATKRIWKMPGIGRHPIWQRNYYERIIRDEEEYYRISQYIETNPMNWDADQFNRSTSD